MESLDSVNDLECMDYRLIPPNLPFPIGLGSLVKSLKEAGSLDERQVAITRGHSAGENMARKEMDL
jgi:hypothetical protein